ncbi:hypothetical protein [Dyella flagellata]|uniref:Uncharacterized protein n=1 Tax=Dyella flagellata TaxID=1867833 RepID=A0ABQ5XE05_9GAMM|nr:hypothetical protein [Dyella flagellata]GLQ89454.1 hypothetical protein GCM10007898_30270 [Dyella flagellata]
MKEENVVTMASEEARAQDGSVQIQVTVCKDTLIPFLVFNPDTATINSKQRVTYVMETYGYAFTSISFTMGGEKPPKYNPHPSPFASPTTSVDVHGSQCGSGGSYTYSVTLTAFLCGDGGVEEDPVTGNTQIHNVPE